MENSMGLKKLKNNYKKSASKSSKQETSDIKWDELVKTVEELKTDADKKLEEISAICLNRECDGKQR